MILPAACAPTFSSHGQTRITSISTPSGLRANLPGHLDVLTIAAAGESSLIERGYVIRRRDGTQGRSTVQAATPSRTRGWRRMFEPTVELVVQQANRGARVVVTLERFGNQAEARAVLDGTLHHLGL